MISYTIIAEENDRQVRSYIKANYPLTGEEKMVKDRFASITEMLGSDGQVAELAQQLETKWQETV
jgi:hypothetical protein